MSDALVIRKLAIKHTPGFPNDRLKPMEFCAGVNIVFGPNASGKTTTARAIQCLLWPQTGSAETFLTAEISLNGQTGQFTCGGGARQESGLALPFIGDPSYRLRYMLAQHELLAADETGRDFAQQVLKEARGGLDLEAARKLLGYAPPGPGRRAPELIEARKRYETAKGAEKDTLDDERRLEELKRELAAAQQAQDELGRITLALEYLQQAHVQEQLDFTLQGFPPELDGLNGNELDTLDELAKQIEDAATRQQVAAQDIANAQEGMRRADLADPTAVEQAVAAVKAVRDEMILLETELRAQRAGHQRAESEAKAAYRNLGGLDAAAYANPLDAAAVQELEAFARKAEGLREKRQALDDHRRWLQSIKPPQEGLRAEFLREAIRCLQGWLAAAEAAPDTARWQPLAGMIVSALVALFGLLALLQKSVFGIPALLGGIGVFVLFLLLSRPRGSTGPTRGELAHKFAQFCLGAPASWAEGDVERLIGELTAKIAAIELAEHAAGKERELSLEEQALDEDIRRLDEEKTRIAWLLGADPAKAYAGGNASLFYFVSQLLEWQRKSAVVKAAGAEMARLEEELAGKAEQAHAKLAAYGYPPAAGSGEIGSNAQLLETRGTTYRQAEEKCRGAQVRLEEAEAQVGALAVKRAAFLARLGVDPDPEAAREQLDGYLEQLAEYGTKKRALHDASAVRAETERKGRQCPDWENLLTAGETALRRRQEEMQRQAARVAEIGAEIGTCEHRISIAKAQAACEGARAALETITGKLRRKMEDDLRAAVGWYITTELEKQGSGADLPDVFLRARQLFAEFTSARYELRIDREANRFRAFDTVDKELRGLDQLSSATRVQLLMAVRVAFVERREQGVKLPLLMDETLACSDETREREIIEASLRICAEGRQLFYFTGKPAELAKWKALAEQYGVPLQVVYLDRTPADRVVPEAAVERAALPDPAGHDHASYGQALGVPELDFRREGATGAHVWYVVEDPVRLRVLLENGITRCGQLRAPYLADPVDFLIGTEAGRKARGLAQLLEALEELWREGRGEPLTYGLLQESKILTTDTYKQEIPALAEALGWDAKALLAAFEDRRVRNLRESSIQRFREFCEDKGCYVEGDPLPTAEIHDRLLGRAIDLITAQVVSAEDVQRLCERVLELESAQ
ncbi:MAG: hypothetical protein ACYC6A_12900 [Armatimonadota bacterium]